MRITEPLEVVMWRLMKGLKGKLSEIEGCLMAHGIQECPRNCFNCLNYIRETNQCARTQDDSDESQYATVPAEFAMTLDACPIWQHEEDYPF